MKRKLSVFMLLVLLLAMVTLPAQASELGYVTDAAEILDYDQWETLETLCGSVSDQYGCGVYAVTVADHREFGNEDIYEVAYGIYHDYALGKGAGRDGVLLLLSMDTRDFALFVYGDNAEYAFDEYGQEMLEGEFLPHFQNDDWYGGFQSYAKTCGAYLSAAQAGEPVRDGKGMEILLCIGASFLASLIVVLILKAGMKNVEKQTQAGAYLTGAVNLTACHDQFIRTTVTRTKIETDDDDSKARSGGGGSGRSGKF